MLRLIAALAAITASALGMASHAGAQTTLKFAHIFPASHYLWEQAGKVFTEAVTARTNGRVKFEVYPAGQLGKDYLALLKSGIADIAIIVPSYAADKFPLTSVAELPGLYGSSCEGTSKFWNVVKDGAQLNDAEYKNQGLHVLFASVLPPYQVMTSSKRVERLEDLSGLKLRANGVAMDKTIRALGSVSVRIPAPEFFEALSRGTVDGGFYPYSGLASYRLEKVLRNSVTGVQLGAGSVVFAMSDRVWTTLPADIKNAMNGAATSTQANLCKWQDDEEKEVQAKLSAEGGHQVVVLGPQEAARWQDRVNTVTTDWGKEMDGVGKNGTALLKSFRDARGDGS